MSQTVGGALRAAAGTLSDRLAPEEALRDARLLMQHATGWTGAGVLSRDRDPLDPALAADFAVLIQARSAGKSVPHIVGWTEFHGRRFAVGPGDLAPRPDTETLIEVALSETFGTVLDLGTGTGIIAQSLLLERPGARGLATDLSDDALRTARANAAGHGLEGRLTHQVADWFSGIAGQFDLIVSNPPYVTEAAYGELPPEITDWERRAALTPGGDGLDAYRAIAAGAADHMTLGGRLIVEIGWDQGAAVSRIFETAGLDAIAVHPDINGRDRVVGARKLADPARNTR